MESGSLSLIVPIVVGVIIFLLEKASEKKNTSKAADKPRRPMAAVSHQDEESARRVEAERHAALARRRAAASVKAEEKAVPPVSVPVAPLVAEEGMRVTVDKPAKVRAKARPLVSSVSGGDLRKAVIWSEILKRKF